MERRNLGLYLELNCFCYILQFDVIPPPPGKNGVPNEFDCCHTDSRQGKVADKWLTCMLRQSLNSL